MAILKLTIFNTLSPNKVSTKFRPNISNATDNAYRSGGNLTKIHQIHELLYSSVPMNQRDLHSHSMVFSHVCANRCCYFFFSTHQTTSPIRIESMERLKFNTENQE